jgi:hypothetical protein
MAQPTSHPQLAALRAAIGAFIVERRGWPASRRAQAQREMSELQRLLEKAADQMGVKLRRPNEPGPGDGSGH